MFADFLNNFLTSALCKTLNDDEPDETKHVTTKDILQKYGLTMLSKSTATRWLNQLGYTYCERKKCYYNDNHEKEENVNYRMKFIHTYLFDYEFRAHRWIQLSEERVIELERTKEVDRSNAYNFLNQDTNSTFYEFHVDDHDIFKTLLSDTAYGGHLSVRKRLDTKPIIILGQDECIFKQYALTKKTWNSPDGKVPLVPKSEGQGVMISSFVCREFGTGLKLDDNDLRLINEKRRNENYVDESAALKKMEKT